MARRDNDKKMDIASGMRLTRGVLETLMPHIKLDALDARFNAKANATSLAAKLDKTEAATTYAAKSVETSKLDKTEAASTYAQAWKANTSYTAGQPVVNPYGDVVTAKTAFTSGTSYSAANWNTAPGLAAKVDNGTVPPGRIRMPQVFKRWGTPFSHSWVSGTGNASTLNMNYTGSFILSGQSIRITTFGDGVSKAVVDLNHGTAIDATGKTFRVWIKVSDVSKLTQLNFYAGDAGQTNAYVWTLAYQQAALVDENRLFRNGEWVGITLPWSEVTVLGAPTRNALSQFRVTVKDTAGGGAITVDFNGADLITPETTFPTGVVSLTFDDGPTGQYNLAAQKNDQYGYPATFYIIPEQVGVSTNITLAQLKELETKGNEVAAHSYTVASHNPGFSSLSTAALEADFVAMRSWLANNGFRGVNHGAWPHGARTTAVEAVASKYVSAERGTTSGQRMETLPPANPMNLRCYLMDVSIPPATITAAIDKAYANGEWLILCFHGITTGSSDTYWYNNTDYKTIVDYINAKGIPVRTVGNVLNTLRHF